LQLSLERVTKKVGAQTWLYEQSIAPHSGEVTVLLGATQAGKTSLMRLMAGLDTPTSGKVLVNGEDVTGVPVRQRNVAMVYQQFINYPSLTVAQNIASPLRLRGESRIDERVGELADKLHIGMFLQRYPAELSGGQQQRVALARALAKNAPLMLLDEPLVNLDYKLREELREELVQKSLRVARAFSDPPMNLIPAQVRPDGVQLDAGPLLTAVALPAAATPSLTVGVRANALRLTRREGDVVLPGTVELAEISGSDTFVHVATPVGELVAQLTGVHNLDLGAVVSLHLHPSQVFVFDAAGALLVAPHHQGLRQAGGAR
jgi:glycerol transport system ATP-binding protein